MLGHQNLSGCCVIHSHSLPPLGLLRSRPTGAIYMRLLVGNFPGVCSSCSSQAAGAADENLASVEDFAAAPRALRQSR